MTITTNQGLIVADATDVNDVPASFTELLSGGVTPSAGLENRLVQRYSSSTDRTTRNPTPNEGELSYLTSTDVYQWYNGTTWVDLAKGYVSETTRTSNTASFTTTEIISDQLSFTAIAGLRYKLSWGGSMQSSVTTDLGRFFFRWQAGGTLTTAGTAFFTDGITFPQANRGTSVFRSKTITGITAGTASIGVGMVRDSGSGNLLGAASATQQVVLLLEIV